MCQPEPYGLTKQTLLFFQWLAHLNKKDNVYELQKWSSHLLDNLSNCRTCTWKKIRVTSTKFEPLNLGCRCSALTNWAMKSHNWVLNPMVTKNQPIFTKLVTNGFMLSVRTSRKGCTREVWRARKMRKSSSRRSSSLLSTIQTSKVHPFLYRCTLS